MSHNSSCANHSDGCHCSSQTAVQSLDEMDFERGIWSAAFYGEVDKVQRLIDSGRYNVDQRDSAGYTALHYCARAGHLDVCKYLIGRGAQVDATTKSGQATALHRACAAGKTTIVRFLLSVKADVNLQDADGKTSLHRASENNHVEISKLLVSQFPHIKDIVDNKGNKPKLEW